MTEQDLSYFKNWFDDFSGSHYSQDKEDQKNILLKVVHTHHVCENILEIINSLSPGGNDKRLAETVALFHDIGRFPQYARYKTFKDAVSVNHGLLGTKTLIEKNILRDLSEDERILIINTVKFHGALAIPKDMDDRTAFFLKLVRDADKVDIYRVFIEYYESPAGERASATAFGVPDTPEYSKIMLSSIFERKVASYSSIKTENDFRIMKLSWVFDMNFRESIRLLQERNYIGKIADKLPQTEEVVKALSFLQQYVTERLENG
ncbi:MAG: HD family phosphohydrolase [Nitrospiraceae bacterium]|nr:MAG: HD family phosphohydrolase [Nitrospiraceae bacterium]